VHTVDPTLASSKTPHAVHASVPVVDLNFPKSQFTQRPSDAVFPAGHVESTHGPPAGPVFPALQVHAVTAELVMGELEFVGQVSQVIDVTAAFAVEYFPAAQLVHTALPVVILYVPTTHGEQGPPFGPVYPGLQVQVVTVVLDVGEVVLPGQV